MTTGTAPAPEAIDVTNAPAGGSADDQFGEDYNNDIPLVSEDAPLPGEERAAPTGDVERPSGSQHPGDSNNSADRLRAKDGRFTSPEKQAAEAQESLDQRRRDIDAVQERIYKQVRGIKQNDDANDEGVRSESKAPAHQAPPAEKTAEEMTKLAQAKHILRRAKWGENQFNHASDEEILAKAAELKPFFDNVDTDPRFAKPTKGKATTSQASTKEAVVRSRRDERVTDHGSEQGDLDALLDQLDDPETTQDTSSNDQDPRVRQAEERATAAQIELARSHFAQAVSAVQTDFPQLKDRAGQERLLLKMQELDPGEHAIREGVGALTELIRDAAKIVFFDEIRQQSQRSRLEQNRKVLASQPTRVTEGSAVAKKPTPDQIRDRIYKQVVRQQRPTQVPGGMRYAS